MKSATGKNIRIIQPDANAPLQLEVGTHRYISPEPLGQEAQQRLIKIADMLHAWARVRATAAAIPAQPVRTDASSTPEGEAEATSPLPEETQPPPRTPRLASGQVATPALADEFNEPFWRRLLDAILMRDERLPVRPSLDSELAFASGSFVNELESILQTHLARRETPFEKKIRLSTGLGGKLQIAVGEERYDTVPDIPDKEMRRVLQQVIAEWEDKH